MRTAVRVATALVCVLPAFCQQPPQPTVYTYVTEWTIPRAQWDGANSFYEKSIRAIMDRHLQSGDIVEWGRAVPVVHSAKGSTHVNWYAGSSMAGIYRVLEDLRKLPLDPAMMSGTHFDQFLQSGTYHAPKDMPRRSAYMMTSTHNVQPGKGAAWREMWDRESGTVYADLMKQGTLLGYGFDMEAVHTGPPSARYEWVLLPNMESVDKMADAFRSRAQARSAEENRTRGAAMREVLDNNSHRDGLYYVVDYAHK